MAGILGNEFTKFIYNYGGDHMINEYVGVYASNEIDSFIPLAAEIRRRNHYLPFIVLNTDRNDQEGTHWMSLLNFCPNTNILLFDSFGEIGLKHFLITTENIKYIKTFFKLIKKTQVSIVFEFNSNAFKNAPNIDYLSKFAYDLFNFLNEFCEYNDLEKIHLYYSKNQIQTISSSYCGPYVLYYLYNLFNPFESSSIVEDRLCSINTIEKLLKELFFINSPEKNDNNIVKFIEKFNIKGDYGTNKKSTETDEQTTE